MSVEIFVNDQGFAEWKHTFIKFCLVCVLDAISFRNINNHELFYRSILGILLPKPVVYASCPYHDVQDI